MVEPDAEHFRAARGVWMETRDYEDWWILVTLIHANDSVAKNA